MPQHDPFKRDEFPFAVLLTAVDEVTLTSFTDTHRLPSFADGPQWSVRVETNEDSAWFDLAVVLAEEGWLSSACAELAQGIASRGVPTILLLRSDYACEAPVVPGVLLVGTTDTFVAALTALANAVLAPVQQDGLVCCDWADISNVMADGARARLVWTAAPSSKEAAALLGNALVPLAKGDAFGVIASLAITSGGKMRDWYPFRNQMALVTRQDAMVLVSAPLSSQPTAFAAALIVTAPSTRYFRDGRSV